MRIPYARGRATARRGLIPTLLGYLAGKRAAAEEFAGAVGVEKGRRRDGGVVVIMGATGTGKSKLSIDVGTRIPAEVVNADKIQVYRGLDITTNKISIDDRRGVPHHLLGELDPAGGELSPAGFRSLARMAVERISSRGLIPVVAGGSNSYIHAMMVDRYDERENPFAGAPAARHRFRHPSCFLWVDVEAAVLAEHLDRRVDDMLGMGMVEELEMYFSGDGSAAVDRHPGLGKAIGVPEFREYFRRRTPAAYEDAVTAIKENTRRLAEEQVRKIERLAELGWPILRVDATTAVMARLAGAGRPAEAEAWERDVLGPSLRAVERFLHEHQAQHRQLPPHNK
ncbi:hypothetical protein KSP39_PZI005654 [Platanthera zijinensis]|uniref:Uncharacterized protein n=1 Tax=Platanthera zijinensis TaxID=2320716 RepID=A0AAP0BRG6_9ASPA